MSGPARPPLPIHRSAEPWRDLASRAGTGPDAAREFPPGADAPPDGVSRRDFVRLLGLGAAAAGAAACGPPAERILPYTRQPPEVTPGVPRWYATAMTLGGYATGLLVESHAGRPVKVEGNPDHPASLGAAGVHEQAWPLELYDPGRATRVLHRGAPSSPDAFLRAAADPSLGDGLHLLMEPTSSPLLLDLLDRVRARHPGARVHFFAPLAAEGAWAGARMAFGRPLQAQYDVRAAEVILSLDADFLASMPFHLRYARHWAGRRVPDADAPMSRLYVAEGMLSVTGGAADHRLRVRPSRVGAVAAAVLAELATLGVRAEGGAAIPSIDVPDAWAPWVRAVAADLARARGRSLVVAGERQAPEVHALAWLLNDALGNLGRTVHATEPVLAGAGDDEAGIVSLARALRAGEVRTLAVLGADPVRTAPADLRLGTLLETVPATLCLDGFRTETARRCDWFVPALHPLETWGDARAYDGTVSLVQPLIRPLYPDSLAEAQVLAALAGEPDASPHDLLRAYWRARADGDFGRWWDDALQRGIIPGTEAPRVDVRPRPGLLADAIERIGRRGDEGGWEAVFAASPAVYDGRFAGNAWLMEFPDPVTKLTWDNAALLSPRGAASLGVDQGDVVAVAHGDRTVELPAFVLPGMADGVVGLHLGYGRTDRAVQAVEDADGGGFDVYPLRTVETPYVARGVSIVPTGASYPLATTQAHWSMEGRPIVRTATVDELRTAADRIEGDEDRPSLYDPFPEEGVQWGMSIDLSLCTGCSACVVACQAENNVPVVGKMGVMRSREMHWLRIDRYFAGTPDDPVVLQQPMLCQHCEKAPCEYVCPVNATTHSPDGLNEMTYNRCIGTRFCSNNCPYKVRRFNWFDYNGRKRGTPLALAMNPDVTVRDRGVIEKCTFCVQRIRRAQIDARMEGADIHHAPLQTACQQACPTRAIRFGALTDAESPVSRAWRDPRAYAVLGHLGTEPRVRYLARVSNPAPGVDATSGGGG